MNHIAEDILMHYGMPRRSGRYPYGSGKDPYQRNNRDFLGRIEELKKQGFTEDAESVKAEFGMTLNQYRARKAIAKDERTLYQIATAKSLQKDGKGPTEIGRELGVPESTVRGWLTNTDLEKNRSAAMNTANQLKQLADEKDMVEVGVGVERELRISKEKLNQALAILKEQGYNVYPGGIPQATNPGQQTTQLVLCKPGIQHKEIYEFDRISTVKDYTSDDGGETFRKLEYPKSLDSSRIMIRYKDDKGPDGATGDDKDGLVEIRRGVDDLSLGNERYAQVRILVDDTKYIKGMAVYSDDMPDGVDIVFNTNKSRDVAKMDVLKDIKKDPDNPFGALIKANGQSKYIDKDGNEQLSPINKTRSEGDWDEWADALPSQFLSKQSTSMAKKQLDIARADKLAEYQEICSLTNPTIKKHFLEKFASQCDAAASDLKAAALPGQRYHVMIPINTLKDNEVYAPNYEDGTKLALIRYPHGGIFEIPVLTVNNKHAPAKKVIGIDSIDAVGINKKNADKLSGADFDGDTVMCIPTHDKAGRVKIASRDGLEGLEGFDPKATYPERPGMKYMKDPITGKDSTQKEMGVISNLITDMTLSGGATDDELAAAVRHSMVVIDAAKHKLDYKQSEIDNNIDALKKKYQVKVREDGTLKTGGASTLISRAKGEATVDKRQGTPKVNIKGSKDYDPTRPEGALIYKKADDLYYPERVSYDKETGIVTYKTTTRGGKVSYNINDKDAVNKYSPVKVTDPDGTVRYTNKAGDIEYRVGKRTQKSTQMAEVDDARDLISAARHPMEVLYADYANSMKSMANQARKEMMSTGKIEVNSTAKTTYQAEVSSLMSKLNTALLNAPREREANRLAYIEVESKKEANPGYSKSDVKKWNQQAITKYRDRVGATSRRDRNIDITDKEWEAIQAGAIAESNLKKILDNTDIDVLRERATPRTHSSLSTSQITRIRAMSGTYTLQQLADKFGVSTSTVSKYLKGAS